MKRKALYRAALLMVLAMGMTACGDGSEETTDATAGTIVETTPEQITELVSEPMLSDEENAILDYELRYSMGEFAVEDYQELAALYQEQGMIRKQRDMLEKSYRLFDDQQAFEILQTINVNLEEEEASIQEQANLMLQNLELEEYLNESINLISTEEWFQAMMPKLREGSRNYFLQRDGKTALSIQVGYEQSGAPYAKVWYMGEQVKVLRKSGDAVQLLVTQLVDGNYQGAFESWTCDGSTGDIHHETGTFGNGVLTGDYTISIHEGTEASDVFSLWSNKEGMEYTTYTGNFNEKGISTLEQPAEKKIASLVKGTDYSTCIVYAIDVNDCLFEGLAEGADPATYVFGIETMGWEPYPALATYEVVEDAENGVEDSNTAKTDIKVRVFDGEIQVYVGSMWIDMGNVEDYIKEDPFLVYENSTQNAQPEASEGEQENGDGEEAVFGGLGHKRTGGTIPKDVVKPATKPAPQQPTPAPAPEPQPEPNKKPSSNNNSSSNNSSGNNNSSNSGGGSTDSGSSGGGSADSGSSEGGSSNSGSTGGGNSDSGSTGGGSNNSGNSGGNDSNDVDVEWTPDIM